MGAQRPRTHTRAMKAQEVVARFRRLEAVNAEWEARLKPLLIKWRAPNAWPEPNSLEKAYVDARGFWLVQYEAFAADVRSIWPADEAIARGLVIIGLLVRETEQANFWRALEKEINLEY